MYSENVWGHHSIHREVLVSEVWSGASLDCPEAAYVPDTMTVESVVLQQDLQEENALGARAELNCSVTLEYHKSRGVRPALKRTGAAASHCQHAGDANRARLRAEE